MKWPPAKTHDAILKNVTGHLCTKRATIRVH